MTDDLLQTPVQLLTPDGEHSPAGSFPMPSDEGLLRAYAAMVRGRRMNDQASALVRQGRLAVYPSSHGQEACQIAAAHVLGDDDWLFPTYRDTVSVAARGVEPAEVLTLLRGDWHHGYDVGRWRIAPLSTPLATQLPHAVGVAHAATLRGEQTVVMALCGDGGTSEGDFHEAMNFAAVFHAPVVFLIQNNGYAISVPLSRQTAAPSLAHKAAGYGMPGVRVDGNDVAALLSVVGRAVVRARAGDGPQLIEAHTYRMEAHTNADDASRYRDDAEVQPWHDRDPLRRVAAYLRATGALLDDEQARMDRDAEEMAQAMRDAVAAQTEPSRLFEHVYSRPTQQLTEQAEFLAHEVDRS